VSLEQTALSYLDAHEDELSRVAKDIWDYAEIGLQETRSSKLVADELEKAGFSIEWGTGGIPTAFVASWGEGKPIIGILAEYDALPGLSQRVSATKEPVEEGAPGHGCGHNLFGAGSLGAALATKEAMEKEGIEGTLRFYGCPAEETCVGKVFMAADGVFDDLDAAIAWHPGYANSVWGHGSSLALNSFKVNFHGVASHAAAAPHAGRSALDGVQLMDVGVNYLREHIVQEARVHCVITNGGKAPNVVPPYAQVWYFVRAPHREQVNEIYSRMLDIAKGAALMTGTTYDIDFLTGCYELMSNDVLGNVMLEKLRKVGSPKFTEEEKEFAKELQATLPPGAIEMTVAMTLKMSRKGLTPEDLGDPFCEKVIEPSLEHNVLPGSTDVSDVSQITPTCNLTTCCQPLGAPPHSWQVVAASGSSIGFKGMMVAAKVMALTALDLVTKPDVLKAARDEFVKSTKGKEYVSPLPEGTVPH